MDTLKHLNVDKLITPKVFYCVEDDKIVVYTEIHNVFSLQDELGTRIFSKDLGDFELTPELMGYTYIGDL